MQELAALGIGWREGIWVLLGLVAVYIAYVLIRMRRLSASKTARDARPDTPAPQVPVDAPDTEEADEALTYARYSPPPASSPSPDLRALTPAVVAEAVLRRDLEDQIAQLRDEVDAVRGELAALRGELQQEMAHVRAAQSISPIYGDAMQMAAAGYDPAVIAERCGIARAEAELVVALANSQRSQ